MQEKKQETMQEANIVEKGLKTLVEGLGLSSAVYFIAYLKSNDFDYTEYRKTLLYHLNKEQKEHIKEQLQKEETPKDLNASCKII